MRKTKIVATVGPASATSEGILALVEAGADILRVSFAHGTHELIGTWCQAIRDIAHRLGRPLPIMSDLSGPKIRVGVLEKPLELQPGERIPVHGGAALRARRAIPTNYADLSRLLSTGDRVLIDDGLIELRVVSASSEAAECEVTIGGQVRSHHRINVAGLKPPFRLTEKDLHDLAFSIEQRVDLITVPSPHVVGDIAELQRRLDEQGASIPVLARIAHERAIANLAPILEACHGLILARGELAVEVSPTKVPVLQKRVVEAAVRRGKPVMLATEMLDSMVQSAMPMRIEAADLFHAVHEGCNGIILAASTSLGRYPRESVAAAAEIIAEAETMLAQPLGFFSCFISFSERDRPFAERLRLDLQDRGVRCWFAPEDLEIGGRIRVKIDESIRDYDKLLLILSRHALASQWIEHEVESALAKERDGGGTVVFPIRIDDAIMSSVSGWAGLIRNTRQVGDFTGWKNHDQYQRALEKLFRDLSTSR